MISIGIDKFIAVITDNANNMKLAWRILKEKYADKIFLGCWANGINLLDPRFNGELVNSGNWHDIIEEEIIRIAGEDNEVQSRYPLLSSVAIKVLSIPASSAVSERNWSTYNFIHSKLRNRMVIDRAEKLVYILEYQNSLRIGSAAYGQRIN
ncbi:unnamed protein product [Rhizophagus irregularis]|nr:unnamed protein product [Rhizophagus irregularis]CAB4410371.1 unnamed protein product [Rhizophagus irregularis]